MQFSRDKMVAQMKSYLGAATGNAKHRHIVDTYNAFVASGKTKGSKYKMKYTDPWCATTVSACAIECGYAEQLIPVECSCTRMIKLMMPMDIYEPDDNYIPAPGDVIFYNWGATSEAQDNGADGIANHVGLVIECDGKNLVAIEGNYNDKCQTRKIKVGWKYICGYGVPKYTTDTEVIYIVKRGDTLSKIAKMYNTTVSAIMKLNPQIEDPNKIYVGQKIRVR